MVNSQAPIPNIANSPGQHYSHLLGGKLADGNPSEYVFTLGFIQDFACGLLKEVHIESAMLEAQLLLGHVLGLDRISVNVSRHVNVAHEQAMQFWALLKRRLCREPIAYLLGYKEFYGLTFFVNKDCLIPRPDTEVVVEKCLELLHAQQEAVVFDICTGSGAIAHALLASKQDLRVIGSDICQRALSLAQINAKNLGVEQRFQARQGDLLACFCAHEKAFLIVSNPPYISTSAMKDLARDIVDFEPHHALHAGDEYGISYYARILNAAGSHLERGGYLVFEVGFDQREKITSLLGPAWRLVEFFKDLSGNTRGVVVQKI